jgi:acyl-coenzyme A thioesterase PaaI-like protein
MEEEEPDLVHFQSIPWCATLLSDPALKPTPTFSREPKPSTEDSLVAETLKTSTTISHCVSVLKQPTQPLAFIDELHLFVTVGSGMNGGANLLHGGIITTLMDDAMGTLLTVNNAMGTIHGREIQHGTVTANLEVRFLKPVPTPGTFVVSVWCEERTERKFWFRARLRGERGVDMATAKALWIRIDRGKVKL